METFFISTTILILNRLWRRRECYRRDDTLYTSCILVSRSNLEYMQLSMWTIRMGSQAAQMFVKVTTSLNKIVHTSNSPVKDRHIDRATDKYAWHRRLGCLDRQTRLPLRSCRLWADWLRDVEAWHTAESPSSLFPLLGAARGFSIPPVETHTVGM